eukprot:695752-Pyramimonas_sp.AAC.1
MESFWRYGTKIFRLMSLLWGSECNGACAFQLAMEESVFESMCIHGVQRVLKPRHCFQSVAEGAGEGRAQVIAVLFRGSVSNCCVRPLDSCRLRWR